MATTTAKTVRAKKSSANRGLDAAKGRLAHRARLVRKLGREIRTELGGDLNATAKTVENVVLGAIPGPVFDAVDRFVAEWSPCDEFEDPDTAGIEIDGSDDVDREWS